ncbi:MAG: hypothetical protein K5634_01605 [Sphaerochaetaceae bacterium]|nr:hypothetical protein [Sphaerochaetaceae bacterium]
MNRNRTKAFVTVILLALLMVLSSCQVTQNVNCTNSSDPLMGGSSTTIKTDSFFEGVLEDLSSWKSTGSNDPVVDVAISSFAQNLSNSKYSDSVRFIKTDEHSYSGTFVFTDFKKLIQDLCGEYKDQNLLTLTTTKDGKTRLELNISLENYDVLASIVPFLSDPNFEVWGPKYNDYLSEEEYKELVSFVLGEEGPASIDSSIITITLKAPGKITSTNGTIKQNNTVEFSFPLIKFLLLHEPLYFYCEI